MKRKVFDSNGFCLVLSGGGAKGIYHIGVWRALRELKIGVDAFIGSSIGAIIAGYLAQGNYDGLERMGEEVSLNFVVDVPDSLIEGGEVKITPQNVDVFQNYYRQSFKKGGLDTSPLRAVLKRDLNEEKLRKSGKDLGVVTYNVTDMKTCQVFLDEMEPGTAIDYLMASSAIPGFKSPVIKGKKFIDGGVADNIPFGMARARGYRKIIVVDISGIGVVKKPEAEGTLTVYIKNSIQMGGILNFNREFLSAYRDLGYLDTLKAFGVLKGYEFFIEPVKDSGRILADVLDNPRYLPVYRKHLKSCETTAGRVCGMREILPPEMRSDRNLLYPYIDCAASILKIDRIRLYDYKELAKRIRAAKAVEDGKISKIKKDLAANTSKDVMAKMVTLAVSFKSVSRDGETPYFYYRLAEKVLKKALPAANIKDLARLFPKLGAGMLFLDILESYKK